MKGVNLPEQYSEVDEEFLCIAEHVSRAGVISYEQPVGVDLIRMVEGGRGDYFNCLITLPLYEGYEGTTTDGLVFFCVSTSTTLDESCFNEDTRTLCYKLGNMCLVGARKTNEQVLKGETTCSKVIA